MTEYQKCYLKEFVYLDGYTEIVMDIVDIDSERGFIKVAQTEQGKISVREYDLKRDETGNLYFEYGWQRTQIKVDDFEEVADE